MERHSRLADFAWSSFVETLGGDFVVYSAEGGSSAEEVRGTQAEPIPLQATTDGGDYCCLQATADEGSARGETDGALLSSRVGGYDVGIGERGAGDEACEGFGEGGSELTDSELLHAVEEIEGRDGEGEGPSEMTAAGEGMTGSELMDATVSVEDIYRRYPNVGTDELGLILLTEMCDRVS